MKDLEWLKKEFDEVIESRRQPNPSSSWGMGSNTVLQHIKEDFKNLIDHLDEPEVLSQEWIDEHVDYADVRGDTQAFIHVDDLQNLLVPKQEITFEQAYDKLREESILSEKSFDYYWNCISDNVEIDEPGNLLVPKQEVTEKQAYDKIAESFPATAKEIEAVLEKYYSSMLIEFSEELHETIMRAFDVEATSKTIEALTGMTLEQIAEEARNGGIVPKESLGNSQELEKVQIPQFVADWIEEVKPDNSLRVAFEYIAQQKKDNHDDELAFWVEEGNSETFARAWLDGYEVEEEQKYYVMNNDNRMMLVRMMDGKTITEADPFKLEDMYEAEKKSHRLTEQEIKDYDERYWPFAVKVEELEE